MDSAPPVRATEAGANPGAGSRVAYEGVTVAYRGHVVLKPLTLEIAAGEILALIGPSGSGKTTALRAVAGFVRPSSGRIRIGDTDVTDLPPHQRGIAMVVQNYALFPHMRVEDNVAFGLRARGAPKTLIAERVAETLEIVGMSSYRKRFPRELSGGQQQRVAIARALAVRPRVLLLDEPLSALDAQIRRGMVEEIARLHRELPQLTILYVTHDQTEALTLADRIAIMRAGEISALGASGELYRRPPNRFAAEFLGRANLLPVTVTQKAANDDIARVRLGDLDMACCGIDAEVGARRLLCLRPQHVTLAPDAHTINRIAGTLDEIHWQGELTHFVVNVDGHRMRVVVTRPPAATPRTGATIEVYFAPTDASLIPEEVLA
ncbi:MAG TPA: ATP-binding cassette domain-containing protein [Burkholderiaceae bacterium]|nr:ATP-binding cassette domain-containing protein [Burkholderiaceae bacterium]